MATDFSVFGADQFDTKRWINDIIRKGKADGQRLDPFLQTLVMKLQLLSNDVNTALEQTTTQMLSAMPAVVKEVEKVSRDAEQIKKEVAETLEEIAELERVGKPTVAELTSLHEIKVKYFSSLFFSKKRHFWTDLS